MKGWIATAIASIAIIGTLFLDPSLIPATGDITNTRYIMVAVLLGLVGIAFILGHQTSEIFISRHVAFWSAVLGVITIGALNIDLFTNTHVREVSVKKSTPQPIKAPKKRRKAAAIYIPDTLKINRVEKIIERQDIAPFAPHEKSKKLVQNKFQTKNAELPNEWQLTEEEKDRFKTLLKQQGLPYNPRTAFQIKPQSNGFSQRSR